MGKTERCPLGRECLFDKLSRSQKRERDQTNVFCECYFTFWKWVDSGSSTVNSESDPELRSYSRAGRDRTGFLVIAGAQGRGHRNPESSGKSSVKRRDHQNPNSRAELQRGS